MNLIFCDGLGRVWGFRVEALGLEVQVGKRAPAWHVSGGEVFYDNTLDHTVVYCNTLS